MEVFFIVEEWAAVVAVGAMNDNSAGVDADDFSVETIPVSAEIGGGRGTVDDANGVENGLGRLRCADRGGALANNGRRLGGGEDGK